VSTSENVLLQVNNYIFILSEDPILGFGQASTQHLKNISKFSVQTIILWTNATVKECIQDIILCTMI
jgi:hypothetical protein